MYKLKTAWKYVLVLIVGLILGNIIQDSNFTYAEQPLGNSAPEVDSPGNWVQEKDIHVYEDKIVINVDNAKWAKFTDTNSMDPVLDQGANAIQISPTLENLAIGDIISYKTDNGVIIHRIVEIENDGEWYAITKGDNNNAIDPSKVRFDQIQKVLIGVIY